MRTASLVMVALALVLSACGSGDGTPPATGTGTTVTPKEFPPAGIHADGNRRVLTTDAFTLAPQAEKYMCWTVSAAEA